jgi:hypothetical protein
MTKQDRDHLSYSNSAAVEGDDDGAYTAQAASNSKCIILQNYPMVAYAES